MTARPHVTLTTRDGSPLRLAGTIGSEWTVEVDLAERPDGPPAVTRISVATRDGLTPLTAEAWRSIPIGEITNEALAVYRQRTDWAELSKRVSRQWLNRWELRSGPKGRFPDEMYARLAQEFLSRVAGGSRSPLVDLSDDFGWPRATTQRRLVEARNRGLLKSRSRGQPGGSLTTKAKALLDVPETERGS